MNIEYMDHSPKTCNASHMSNEKPKMGYISHFLFLMDTFMLAHKESELGQAPRFFTMYLTQVFVTTMSQE